MKSPTPPPPEPAPVGGGGAEDRRERWWHPLVNTLRVLAFLRPMGPEWGPDGRTSGSLTRRMIGIAALWILLLLSGGAFALDRVLVGAVTRNFDDNLAYVLNAMIVQAEIGPDGEVRFNRPLADQRFLEPYSGLYWQVSGKGHDPFPSRSLWDQTLAVDLNRPEPAIDSYDSKQFRDEPLRVIQRDAKLRIIVLRSTAI